MGIAEEYALKVKTPLCRVTITVPIEGVGVDAVGNDYRPEVISCDLSYGFDQASASCTIEVRTPTDMWGNFVLFHPMNRVKVEQGWNTLSTLRTTFFGFVDKVEYGNPPATVKLECRDILKLAQDNYLIHCNRYVYWAEVSEDEFYDLNNPFGATPGDPYGGQSEEDRQCQVIIADMLTDSGIPEDRLHLDFPEYPASGALIIGNNNQAVFCYESAMDACNRICDLIRYKLWADKGGHVQCMQVSPVGTDTPSQTYQSQIDVYAGGTWTTIQAGNLLSINASKEDDLRNWITVYGWYDDNPVTVAGESPYIPTPPTYRRAEVRSYLLDTPELQATVASGIYFDLNRLRYTARATIEGDPRLELGQTIGIYDSHCMTDYIYYFLYDYSSSFKSGDWTMDLNLVGGTGPGTEGSATGPNMPPIAMFTYSVEYEGLVASSVYDVAVDATPSYDPNGDVEDLEYLWVCSGFDNATTKTHVYSVDEGTEAIEVTLTVTDQGTPPLSTSVTQTITVESEDYSVGRYVFVSAGADIMISSDGGLNWDSYTDFT